MSESQYNPLPEGHEGEQQRRTDFESPEEKSAYDAENLISLAKEASKEHGVAVSPMDLITRKDDNFDDLRHAIAIKLKTPPLDKEAAQEGGEVPDTVDSEESTDYESFVSNLSLSEDAREKLRSMLSPKAYQLSLEAAREMGVTHAPTRDQIAAELMSWSVDQLRNICENAEKPTLMIVSDQSFDDGIGAMDANKHYGGQNDAYVYRDLDSPYINAPKPKKGRVSIVDGIVHPKQLDGVSTQVRPRRDHLTEKYEAAGMRHIDGVEMQTLFQRSLIEAAKAGDNNLIVDNWETGDGTVTVLDTGSLTESTLVAYADFVSYHREAFFGAYRPDTEYDLFRGRASVQVMEF